MKKIIMTSFSKKYYVECANRFLKSYKHFNIPFELTVYSEDIQKLPDCELRNALDIPGLSDFIVRHGDEPIYNGKDTRFMTDKARREGYSYKHDALRFVYPPYTQLHAAEQLGEGLLMWLDADCVFRKKIPDNFFEMVLPDNADISYLGRHPKHTETGFIVYRLPEALPMLRRYVEIYEKDQLTNYKEWHNAYIFDRACEETSGIRYHNMTVGKKGHVIHQCVVGKFIDHLKGARKRKGRSWEARG